MYACPVWLHFRFYRNAAHQKVGWEPPHFYHPTAQQVELDRRAVLAAGMSLPEEEDVKVLGCGWSKVWHPEYKCYFFRNDAEQLVQWDTPSALMPEPGTGTGTGNGTGFGPPGNGNGNGNGNGTEAGAAGRRGSDQEDKIRFLV